MNAGILGDLVYYISRDRRGFHRLGVQDCSFNTIQIWGPDKPNELLALAVDPSQNLIHTIDSQRNIQAFSTSRQQPVFSEKIQGGDLTRNLKVSCFIVEGNALAFTSHEAQNGSLMQPNAEDVTSFRVHVMSTDYKHQMCSRIPIEPHNVRLVQTYANDIANPVVSLAFSRSYLKNFLIAATRYHRLYLLMIGTSGVYPAGSTVLSDGRQHSNLRDDIAGGDDGQHNQPRRPDPTRDIPVPQVLANLLPGNCLTLINTRISLHSCKLYA